MPKRVSTPNVPATWMAFVKMSGLIAAKIVGGTTVRANGRRSLLSLCRLNVSVYRPLSPKKNPI